MSARSARAIALDSPGPPARPTDDEELLDGYGVMGLPFTSGHYLALRVYPNTYLGHGFRAVWHRDPAGRWTFYATETPEHSCARYFGAAVSATVRTPIEVTWTDGDAFAVDIPDVLDWRVRLARTAATRLVSRTAGLLPEPAWRSDAVLAVMGPLSGALLHAGRVGLRGAVPNGQHFRANPRRIWDVRESTARLEGTDLGVPGPLPRQDRLGDFWMPQ